MDFLGAHIFHPLGMKSVWNTDEEKLTQTDATAYYRHALGPLRVAPKEGRGWLFAAGELAMTAHDLALWDESLIAQTILKPASYRQMFTEVKLKDGKGTDYGLGVEVSETEGHRTISHDGEVSGFVSENDVRVDDGVAVVVLTNQDAVNAAHTIGSMTADAVLGADSGTAAERQAKAIYRDLQQGRIDRSLLAPNLSDYFTPEALDDFRTSLGPLGEPFSLRQIDDGLRGGMTFRVFRITHRDKRLTLTTYAYPDGKLEQFMVEPAS
jgi:CubicO group peptidase (beta-lactamase class C family)